MFSDFESLPDLQDDETRWRLEEEVRNDERAEMRILRFSEDPKQHAKCLSANRQVKKESSSDEETQCQKDFD